ncbi:phage portal protein [Azospirillum doebereinerae]
MNIPYELLVKDFSQTNYSSARAALLEAWRFFNGRRAWLGTYWATPVFDLWLEEAVNLGEIEAPDFYANRFAYTRCRWIGAGKGWVDPVKEPRPPSCA